MAAARAVILGCESLTLSAAERAFFREADPWGFIVFARNIEDPVQVRRLTSDLRDSVGRAAPILIDQEGGRVARLRAPHWRRFRPAMEETVGRSLAEAAEALVLRYRLIADDLNKAGIDVNCAPLLDVASRRMHDAIGDRALGHDPATVAALGHSVRRGLQAGGVLPIVKHMPGYGRATVDPHHALPIVRESRDMLEWDFAPFKAHTDALMGMTAHLIMEAVDDEYPATFSGPCIDLIREEIGFDGLLMTDDISMQALSGEPGERARASFDAGCDVVLHCNGDMAEMEAIAAAAPVFAGASLRRAKAVDAASRAVQDIDLDEVERRYRALGEVMADA